MSQNMLDIIVEVQATLNHVGACLANERAELSELCHRKAVVVGHLRPMAVACAGMNPAAVADLVATCKWVAQEIEWGHDMAASAAVLKQVVAKATGTD